jgi:L-amino acid N-acyltransferase YncA
MERLAVVTRRATITDLPDIVELYNQGVEDGVATCDLSGFNAEQRVAWFHEHTERFPLWVAEHTGNIVGWTALFPYDNKACFAQTAMFSTYVRREARGLGVGSVLRQLLITEAKRLGFHTIINRVFAINERSIALARKFGFTQVGHMREIVYRDGRYIDCVFFQLLLDEAEPAHVTASIASSEPIDSSSD